MADLKIAVSGASGFIGTALCQALKDQGYEVFPIVRKKTQNPNAIFYDYDEKEIDVDKLRECHAVIHLAGKNIAAGLWTSGFKQELYDSRVKSTRFISHTLARLKDGPRILLNASAVGYYGDQKDLKLDEESRAGHDFLAKLCVDWERGTLFAKSAGLRVVNMRFGIVLDPSGGMLKPMVPIFKHGLGVVLGNGEQYFTYVTRDELVKQILFVLNNDKITGPVNLVSSSPTTNKELSTALAGIFHKKVAFSTPPFLFKLLGDAGEMLLASIRAYPNVLLDAHFPFATNHNIETVLKKLFSDEA